MESDNDFQLLPSSPVPERKLKRLKKATRAPQPDSGNAEEHLPDTNLESGPDLENLGPSPNPNPQPDTPKGVTVDHDGFGAKRVLDFGSESEEHGKVAPESEQARDLYSDEVERKRRSLDDLPEKKEKKKKKRIDDGDGSEKKAKESASNKRKAEKERQETLKQLRADSQRLLRETKDAAFKPAPLHQKPISSILEKIRKRKLEILMKSTASFEDDDESSMDEETPDDGERAEPEETPATWPTATKIDLDTSHIGKCNDAADNSNSESIPSPTAKGSESEHAFQAPVGDTQDLFFDSERGDTIDVAVNENSNDPSEGFAPSMLAMNLKLDSSPLDDDVSSDEEEDNDKENIDPRVHGSVDLTLPPSGDPVRAFVDEEAEEEDDSDNDLQRFQDNEEGEEDDDDIEELNDMIATQYEEKSIDREKRDQLHQKWLEQQDAAGVDNLLQKFNCGSKSKETPSMEEEDDESREIEDDDEAEEYTAPSENLKITLKKVKQMIPQMFTDKDDKYVSSDDEETEEMLARQRLYYKKEEKSKFFSPAEDESSKEVFRLIKKLNVTDNKRKGRNTSAIFAMPSVGQNINISSKSSFVGRSSDRFMPTSRKQGSCKVRSFVFGRDDSNNNSLLTSEDSSDTIQMASQAEPQKTASAKFQRNIQNMNTTLNSATQKSNISLLDILRKSSHRTEYTFQNAKVQAKESIFDAFKLVKKSTKAEARS